MIRDILYNDSLTILLFVSFFLIIILKKIDPSLFYLNISLGKKEFRNKLNNSSIGIKLSDIGYKILYVSNLSIFLTFYDNNSFDLQIYFKFLKYISIFYSLKIFSEIIFANLFEIQKIIGNYLWSKLFYRYSLGLLILLFNFLIAYSDSIVVNSILIIFCMIYFILSYFIIFFSMKKLIIKNWFYFILYLCTLEIIPYYYLISNVL